MTFKELLTRFEEMEWSDNILFVDEKDMESKLCEIVPEFSHALNKKD